MLGLNILLLGKSEVNEKNIWWNFKLPMKINFQVIEENIWE